MSKQKKNTTKETNITEEEVKTEDTTAGEDTILDETITASKETASAEAEVEARDGADAAETESTKAEEEAALSLEEALDLARKKATEFEDNWKRAVAELANYKRRQEEQRKLQRDRIKGEVLEGVVSALDDMNLAFQNLPEELDGQVVGWVEGFRLVQRKLDKILDDQNVMPISTEGKFDPNFHEAVSHEENEDHKDGDIIAELRKGYQIGSRVIRPALVRVAK